MRFSADEAFSHNWLMAKKTGKNHIIFNIINSKMNNTEIYNSPKGKARFLQSNFFLFRKNKGNHFKKGSFQIQPCIRKNSNDQDLLKENKLRETHPNDDNQDNSEVIEFQTAILKPNKSLKKKCSIILMKKEYDEEYNENNEEKSLKKFHNIRTINTLTTISLEELKYIPSRKSSQLGSFLELQSFKNFHEKKVIEQTSEQKKKLKDEEEKEDV